MWAVLIHIVGVVSLVNVASFFLAGNERGPRAGEALIITLPVSVAYVVWLV